MYGATKYRLILYSQVHRCKKRSLVMYNDIANATLGTHVTSSIISNQNLQSSLIVQTSTSKFSTNQANSSSQQESVDLTIIHQ